MAHTEVTPQDDNRIRELAQSMFTMYLEKTELEILQLKAQLADTPDPHAPTFDPIRARL